jgi:hypothetical protein
MTIEEAWVPEPSGCPPVKDDRRGAERHLCHLQPFWRIGGADPRATPPLRIHNLSATGIGLRVRQPLKPGMGLVILLQSHRGRLSRPLAVRVMHATLLADGDWLLGCQFVRRLSEQDMQELLDEQ